MVTEADWYSVWQEQPVPPIGKARCSVCGDQDKGTKLENSTVICFQHASGGMMGICKPCALRLGLKLLQWAETPDGERFSGG